MQVQIDETRKRKVAASAKSLFDLIGMLLAWPTAAWLFYLAGIAIPRVSQQPFVWVVFLFCWFGFQRMYSGLLWFIVLMAKPDWVGVGKSARE